MPSHRSGGCLFCCHLRGQVERVVSGAHVCHGADCVVAKTLVAAISVVRAMAGAVVAGAVAGTDYTLATMVDSIAIRFTAGVKRYSSHSTNRAHLH